MMESKDDHRSDNHNDMSTNIVSSSSYDTDVNRCSNSTHNNDNDLSGNDNDSESIQVCSHIGRSSKINNLVDKVLSVDLIFEQLEAYLSFRSINNLLYVSKKYERVKKVKFYWMLNKKYSIKYYREDAFRMRLNLLLSDVSKQLSLDLQRRDAIEDVSTLDHIHWINLSHCRKLIDISSLRNVSILDIRGCYKIINVTALSNCRTLILDYRQKRTIDVSALVSVNVIYE
jgi:hypothetical protein